MDKPWLAKYEPHVPERIEYPEIVLPEVLKRTAEMYPRRRAMVFKTRSITYASFDRAVNRMAAALQQLGVKKGDRVALQLPNCPQFPVSYYAILRIGGIVVPCNPLYQAEEMTHQLSDSGARVMITLSSNYPVIREIRAQTSLEHVIVAQIKTYFPFMLRLLFGVLREKKMGHRVRIGGDAQTYWYTDVMRRAPSLPAPVPVNGDDTAVLMYTGGTTGVSKGAELTHRNILVNAYQCRVWLNAQSAVHVTIVQLPLFHAYAMTIGMNLAILIAGTMLVIPDPRDFEDLIKTIARYKPTLYPGVPALYNSINNYKNIAKYDLRSIQYCISGASGLPKEIQERFIRLTGGRLVEGYGLSESSPVTHANPLNDNNRIGTIGVPWPDTEVKLVDVARGERIVDPGEEGELCIRGPQIMKGYWNMPQETANALRPDPVDGKPWLYTGDIATMDPEGYFRIVDRKKDIIIGSGGYKIFPREIEEVLFQHPKILDVAAVGVPTEDKGERVKAFIVLKPGEASTPEDMIAFCQEHLAAYKVPKFVEFRTDLPKTIVGKPLRRILRAQEIIKRAQEAKEMAKESVENARAR